MSKQTSMWETVIRQSLTEREMTDAEMKKREKIVMSMKDKEQDFKDRYGDRWQEVMYATATKMAMEEAEPCDCGNDPCTCDHAAENIHEAAGHPMLFDKEEGSGDSWTVSSIPGMKAWLMKAYRQNERNNNHTGNALLMVRLFGTPQEVLLVQKLADIREKEGGIDATRYKNIMTKVDALHKKYYRQLQSLREDAESDTAYQTYFRSMLKKHGYDSPADIPDDKKDEFFNAVDKGYKAKNEAKLALRAKLIEGHDEFDDLEMMKGQLKSVIDRAHALHDRLEQQPPSNVEAWVQAKVTDADTAITSLHDYFMYSDDQNPEFASADHLHEAQIAVKGERPLSGITLPLKKTAALAFAGAFMDRPTGATPEAIVNQALAVYFQRNKTPNVVKLRNLGRMLQLVSKMGINWNEELIPANLVKFVNAAASPSGMPFETEVEEAAEPRMIDALINEAEVLSKPKGPAQSNVQRVVQQQAREKEQLAARHQQQKMSAQQRDFQEKQRKTQAAKKQR